jgi:hypothetical protein
MLDDEAPQELRQDLFAVPHRAVAMRLSLTDCKR